MQEEIIDKNAACEVVTLGPQGSYSDIVSRAIFPGKKHDIIYKKTFPEIAQLVTEKNIYGVVPYENVITGVLFQSQNLLLDNNIIVSKEVIAEISFLFVSCLPAEQTRYCYTQYQAFQQCMKFCGKYLSNAKMIYTYSNSEAAHQFTHDESRYSGAIIPSYLYSTENFCTFRVQKNINDIEDNKTRFFVFSKREKEKKINNGQKTLVHIELLEDKPAILHSILNIFRKYDINMCALNSKSSRVHKNRYGFFIEFIDGNIENKKNCLEELQKGYKNFRFFGSYDSQIINVRTLADVLKFEKSNEN